MPGVTSVGFTHPTAEWEPDLMARPNRNARLESSRGRDAAAPARSVPATRLGALVVALVPLVGCANFVSPISQWRAAYDGKLIRKMSPEEMADASGPADPSNLFQRWLTPKGNPTLKSTQPPTSTLVLGSDGWRPIAKPAPDPEADAEFQAAMKLFEQGKFEEAEKQFARIAKNRKQTTWGENAQLYVAECQFHRKKHVDAHDSYEKLHADYPATNHLDKLTQREYEIAQIWLAQGDPKAPAEKKLPWTAHFDGQLPIIDTDGSALKALEHVEHNNPEGPLADKAGIAIADFYMKHQDYETAAMYYDQFIEFYGKKKSPFLQYAQLAGIDARMKGYQGPDYDAAGLEKARQLIGQTMGTFPERPAGFEKLYLTLDHINDAEAEKTFHIGMQYKRRNKVASAEYYFGKIPQRWPNSPWAVKAKSELAQLAKMPRTPSKPSRIIIPPGATDPFMSAGPMGGMMGGMGGMMGMGGMGMMGMPGGMM
jgi:outer membrane protein assembly factor BamD (BamD/ComL family)